MTDPNRFKLNRGPLFRENKKTNEKAPDYRGTLELDAALGSALVKMYKDRVPIKLEVSGWDSTSNKGTRYIGLQVQVPFEKTGQAPAERPRQPEPSPRRDRNVLDDPDLPF
jgi:uncharacterized protein (DUF736 family)